MSRYFVAVALACFSVQSAVAHDGPEHVIEAINTEIGRTGPTAELLYRRACEHRALRDYERTEIDLKAALELDDNFVAARFELARSLLQRGETKAAFRLAESLVNDDDDDETLRTAAVALRGELHLLAGDALHAVQDFNFALAVRSEVAWFLLRADAQRLLEQPGDLLQGLEEGWQKTASPLLKQALCDACITQGGRLLSQADQIIEQELAEGRYHSTWWIKRARVHAALGNQAEADAHLRKALAEIQSRVNPERPDPTLVAERLTICRLLGIAPPATAVDSDD